MSGNRSVRFSKHWMTGSPIFSVNFTNRKNPAKPNYQMSIKKSQAILKCFIDLKSSVWFTWAQKTKPCSVTLQRELFSARLPLKVLKTLNDQQSLYRVHRKIRVNYKTKTNTLHRAKTLCISLAHTFPALRWPRWGLCRKGRAKLQTQDLLFIIWFASMGT